MILNHSGMSSEIVNPPFNNFPTNKIHILVKILVGSAIFRQPGKSPYQRRQNCDCANHWLNVDCEERCGRPQVGLVGDKITSLRSPLTNMSPG